MWIIVSSAFCLFVFLWLHWVFIVAHGLSLVVTSRGLSFGAARSLLVLTGQSEHPHYCPLYHTSQCLCVHRLKTNKPILMIPWTAAHQALLSMEFSRQEYWSGLPCPSLRDLPAPEIEPGSSTLQADSFLSEPQGKPMASWEGVYDLLLGGSGVAYWISGKLRSRLGVQAGPWRLGSRE